MLTKHFENYFLKIPNVSQAFWRLFFKDSLTGPLRGPHARLPGVYEISRRPSACVKRDHCISMNIIKESGVFTVLTTIFAIIAQRPASRVFFLGYRSDTKSYIARQPDHTYFREHYILWHFGGHMGHCWGTSEALWGTYWAPLGDIRGTLGRNP